MDSRRDLMKGLAALMATGSLAEGATSDWPDAVFPLANAQEKHDPFGVTSVYHEGATDQLKSMTAGTLLLEAHQEPHPPHQHPEEEFMVITEGTGEFLVNGKTSQVGPGALLYCQGNKLHGVKNTGSVPMRFYFFKWQG